MPAAAFTWDDLASLALAVFLFAAGLGLAWTFWRVGVTFGRVSSFITGTEREFLPVLTKMGGTVDRVNGQLDKLDRMTDSAVDAVDSVDAAVRAVSYAVVRPVQKIAGFAAGASYGAASFRASGDWRGAVRAGKEAAARRERDIGDEFHRRSGEGG